MKTKTYIFYCLLISLVIISCDDKLNVEPNLSISDEKALASKDNVKKILLGAYEIQGDGDGHGGYYQITADLLASDKDLSFGGTFNSLRQFFTKEMLSDNVSIRNTWRNAFRSINQCNIVLDNLTLFKDEAEKKTVEGEAKFLRALNYFTMDNLWGNGTKSVPLRVKGITNFDNDLTIERTATTDVMKQVISDLTDASKLLPKSNGIYADKYAALALLARVQLYLGNNKDASDAASDVIENGGNSLSPSFSEAFNHDVDGSEDLFMMQVTSQSGDQTLITHYATEANGGRGGDIFITDDYLALFEEGDERKTFLNPAPNDNRLTSKYTNQFGNIPVLRLGEMYLIRAESRFKLNNTDGALSDINKIRERSKAKSLSAVSLSDIHNERKRELAFEGLSLYDLRRNKTTVKGLAYNSPKLVLPIPQSEIDANSKMEQNEGY